MRCLRKLSILLSVIVLLLMSTGCVDRFLGIDTGHYTGDPLSPEVIESIFDAISSPESERYPSVTDSDGDLIVFWLEHGTVWHISLSCGSIARANKEKVKSGKLSDALSDGKERPCKICSSDMDFSITEEPELRNDSETHNQDSVVTVESDRSTDEASKVYWYVNGTVWHKSLNCSTVLVNGVEGIVIGSLQEALLAGKQRVCKMCSKESDETTYSEIEDTLIPSDSSENDKVTEYPKEYGENGSLIVYWLKGGSVWHESSQCAAVINAIPENLLTGTPYDAYISGKKRACKVCSSDSNVVIDFIETESVTIAADTEPTAVKYPKEYDTDGELIVYWLINGSVWHESARCGTVLKSEIDDVFVGSPLEAYIAGKTRACKICSEDSDIVIDDSAITAPDSIVGTEGDSEKYPRNYDSAGELIVYWIKNGTVWHESAHCSSLRDISDTRIISGSVFDALLTGKERACKICSN